MNIAAFAYLKAGRKVYQYHNCIIKTCENLKDYNHILACKQVQTGVLFKGQIVLLIEQ